MLESVYLPVGFGEDFVYRTPYLPGALVGSEVLARERVGGEEMLEGRSTGALALQQAGTAAQAAFNLLLGPIYAAPGGARARAEQDEDVSEVLVYLYEYLFGGRLPDAHGFRLVSRSIFSSSLTGLQHNA